MALKSIVEVDVNDEKFQAYQARFKAYEDAVASMPGAWAAVANGTDEAIGAFDTLAKKTGAAGDAARVRAMMQGRASELLKRSDAEALTRMGKLGKAGDAVSVTTGRTAQAWRSIAVDAKAVYGHVDASTKSLAKMVMMRGVLGGLLGVGGGLAGLDRLAQGASAGRRQSMSSGVPFGDRNAFKTDYGRFVDPDGMIANLSLAKSDPTSDQYRGLLGAGLSPNQIENQNAADLSVSLLHRLPELFPKGADDKMIGTIANSTGLTNNLSLDEIKAYVRATPQERAEADRSYTSDKRGMAVDGGTLKAWTDLNTQLTRAGSEIEKAFIQGLAPLAPEIADLSKGVVKLVSDFTKSKEVKEDLDALVTGLGNFGKALDDPDSWWNKSGRAMDSFAQKEKGAGEATHSWLKQHAPWATADYWFPSLNENAHLGDRRAHNARVKAAITGDYTHVSQTGTMGDLSKNPNATKDNAASVVTAAKQLGTTPEDLATVIGYETGGTYSPSKWGGKGGNYMGLIQFGPNERQQYGANESQSFPDQMSAVVRYLKDRGYKPGMGLMDLYSTINAGSPGHYNASDGNGTVAEHVARMQQDQAAKARAFVQLAAAARGTTPASPFGAVSDRAAFEAEQRRIAGQAQARDTELLAAYHQQQAAAGTVPHTASLPHPTSHPWTKLADGRTKDDLLTGHIEAMHDATQTGRQMLHDAFMGSISAKNQSFRRSHVRAGRYGRSREEGPRHPARRRSREQSRYCQRQVVGPRLRQALSEAMARHSCDGPIRL